MLQDNPRECSYIEDNIYTFIDKVIAKLVACGSDDPNVPIRIEFHQHLPVPRILDSTGTPWTGL